MKDTQDRAAEQAEEQRCQNLADLANEHMGVENGRMDRFLTAETRDQIDHKHKERRRDEQLSHLQRLLTQNAAYAALYNETLNQLNDMEQKVEIALITAQKALSQAQKDLQTTINNAVTLPNGVRVFKDANGQVWSEHGERIEGDALEEIVWPDETPNYEDYTRQKQSVQDLEKNIHDLEIYQVDVLGHIRNRMRDENNPPDQDELKKFQKDINNGMQKLEISEAHKTQISDISHKPSTVQILSPDNF